MNILEWLLQSDPSVQRLTRKYLLSEPYDYIEEGWIQNFLSLFDAKSRTWGNGYYGPKWISTFYTLRDLLSLEIDPENSNFQSGLKTLITKLWNQKMNVVDDICVVAMFVSMLVYAGYRDGVVFEMVDYILDNPQPDGGWNCEKFRTSTKNSSVHTTLSVLEALRDFNYSNENHRVKDISQMVQEGQEYLMRKKLLRRETDNTLIFNGIDKFHFPTRWKYDYLRVLVYFASVKYPYDDRMEEALELLKRKMKNGYLTKGTTYTGRLHFKMETHRIGSMNSFRGLFVLKFYNTEYYQHLLKKEISI